MSMRRGAQDPGAHPGMDERVFRDSRGIEWEVFDESDALSVALEFDHVPPQSNPGLLFVSTLGRRRLWPCPAGWQFLEDRELEGLCSRAATLM